MRILVLDVGGTHLKVLATGHKQRTEFPSGPKMTPARMVAAVRAATTGWKYEAVSIGYPGVVVHGRPLIEPRHLGSGWVGFDYRKTFGRPVKIVNEDYVGLAGLERQGKKKWRHQVNEVVQQLKSAVQADYVVLGGGNARLLKTLPPGTRLGNNANARQGGYRLWARRYSGSTHERFVH